jgi:hypothetical protein
MMSVPAPVIATPHSVNRQARPICLMLLIRFFCEWERATVGNS